MKSFLLLAFTLLTTTGLMANNGEPSTKNVDLTASKIVWKGYKVTGSHEGTIALKSGTLEMDGDVLTGGTFVIDMTSLAVTDLSGDMAGKLRGHLASADFFGVDNHPTATIELKNVVSRGTPGSYKVTAHLTIKEITKPIKFNVTTENGAMKADIKVDRSEYDVRYGSGSFFDNLGDKTIYDEFDIQVTLVPAA